MSFTTVSKSVFVSLTFIFIGFIWYTHQVTLGILQTKLPSPTSLDFLETRFLYFYLHVFTFIPVFLLSFDKKVAYYKTWKQLIPAIIIVGSFYILWDVIFTAKGVWGFNSDYTTGIRFFHLPIEEWLFFLTVPFACVFIYECLIAYFPNDWLKNIEKPMTWTLIFSFLLVAFLNWNRIYTFSASFLAAMLLIFHIVFLSKSYLSRYYGAFLVSLIPFLLINGVLTGGMTHEPVVIYNPEEFLGIRCFSVPLDDFIYCFGYLLAVVAIYEGFSEKFDPKK